MRIRFTGACLVLAIGLAALGPIAAAQEPDYSANITPLVLSARTHGGTSTVGLATITLAKEGSHEVLIITGIELSAGNPGQPMASPCIITYRYILAAERTNLSAKAACPAGALAIRPQQKYDEMAILMARRVFKGLTEHLEELDSVKERGA